METTPCKFFCPQKASSSSNRAVPALWITTAPSASKWGGRDLRWVSFAWGVGNWMVRRHLPAHTFTITATLVFNQSILYFRCPDAGKLPVMWRIPA
jgi:hypothetical protein